MLAWQAWQVMKIMKMQENYIYDPAQSINQRQIKPQNVKQGREAACSRASI